jgi:uncharacterized membrane protein YgcG
MRSAILLLVLSAAILGSCTSAYKTGQTPDDVYFSPERPQDKYVTAKDDENRYLGNDYSYDDQYLRMKVHNRMMWSDLDDPYFYNPRYSYSYYNNWSNPWSPYTYWNYYYNPYCSPVIYTTPKTFVASNHPRLFNLNTYNNAQLSNNNYTNPKGGLDNSSYNYSGRQVKIVGYTPSHNNSNSGAGNFLRNIFNSSSNNNSSGSSNSSFNSGSRSSGGSSGTSGSSGGGGGGSAPVRRF